MSGSKGYYRQPSLSSAGHVFFTAASSIWRVDVSRGESSEPILASRVTSSDGAMSPSVSPDGNTLAFARKGEVYTLDVGGGGVAACSGAVQRTFEGDATPIGWVAGGTGGGRLLYRSSRRSAPPDARLLTIALGEGVSPFPAKIPLHQAFDGARVVGKGGVEGKDDVEESLFFTRAPGPGAVCYTKMYRGGTRRSIWRVPLPKRAPEGLEKEEEEEKKKTKETRRGGEEGGSMAAWDGWGTGVSSSSPEAVPVTVAFEGSSYSPKYSNGRVYFLADRGASGTINVWSMSSDTREDSHGDSPGGSLSRWTQHTFHEDFDVDSMDVNELAFDVDSMDVNDLDVNDLSNPSDAIGKACVVYSYGGDLWILQVRYCLDSTGGLEGNVCVCVCACVRVWYSSMCSCMCCAVYTWATGMRVKTFDVFDDYDLSCHDMFVL